MVIELHLNYRDFSSLQLLGYSFTELVPLLAVFCKIKLQILVLSVGIPSQIRLQIIGSTSAMSSMDQGMNVGLVDGLSIPMLKCPHLTGYCSTQKQSSFPIVLWNSADEVSAFGPVKLTLPFLSFTNAWATHLLAPCESFLSFTTAEKRGFSWHFFSCCNCM